MKAALIGVGMVADMHALSLRDAKGLELAGVCGSLPASGKDYAARLASEHGTQCRAYGSARAIADDPEVRFVIVATPPHVRLDLIRMLVEAGKPVLLEKPIERTLKGAQAVVAACEGRVPLGMLFQHRAAQASRIMAEKLPELGDLHAVEISAPWWRDQSYYDEPGRGTYARDGGGVMMTQAIHVMDLALSLTGPVTAVQAFARTSKAHRMEAEDFISAGLEFENGAVGSLLASTASFPGRSESITLHGAGGSAVLSRGELVLSWRDGSSETLGTAAKTGAGADPMAFSHGLHQAVIEDFARAVQTGRAPLCSGKEGLKVHALIDALTRSSAEQTRIEVPHV